MEGLGCRGIAGAEAPDGQPAQGGQQYTDAVVVRGRRLGRGRPRADGRGAGGSLRRQWRLGGQGRGRGGDQGLGEAAVEEARFGQRAEEAAGFDRAGARLAGDTPEPRGAVAGRWGRPRPG